MVNSDWSRTLHWRSCQEGFKSNRCNKFSIISELFFYILILTLIRINGSYHDVSIMADCSLFVALAESFRFGTQFEFEGVCA